MCQWAKLGITPWTIKVLLEPEIVVVDGVSHRLGHCRLSSQDAIKQWWYALLVLLQRQPVIEGLTTQRT